MEESPTSIDYVEAFIFPMSFFEGDMNVFWAFSWVLFEIREALVFFLLRLNHLQIHWIVF